MTSLGCVHDECRLLHILTDFQEEEEADTTLQGWLAINKTEIRGRSSNTQSLRGGRHWCLRHA